MARFGGGIERRGRVFGMACLFALGCGGAPSPSNAGLHADGTDAGARMAGPEDAGRTRDDASQADEADAAADADAVAPGCARSEDCMPSCDSDDDCRTFGLLCDRQWSACVECLDSDDCAADRHCQMGICMADVCTAELSACSLDGSAVVTCNADGSSVVERPCPADQRCEATGQGYGCRAESCTPVLTLLIDGSGSTCADFGGQPRWNAVRQALLNPGDGLVHAYAASLPIGVTVFSGSIDLALAVFSPAIPVPAYACDANALPPETTCMTLSMVAEARHNAAAIEALLPAVQPGGSTPTDRAFAALTDNLSAQPSRSHYVVLITDGPPNDICIGGQGGDGTAQQAGLLEAVESAAAAGIITTVVNLETAVPELQAYLDQVAARGDPGAADARAWAAGTPEQLHAALQAAFERAAGCE